MITTRKYADALERFVHEGVTSNSHKSELRRLRQIEYSHGFWHLSDSGKKLAIERGYLQAFVNSEET